MAGKRLLDLVAVFNASRGVAHKHVALRSRQVDVYSRTSTLARAVRNQTDRVTETVKAASILASRLNENAPPWTYGAEDGKVAGEEQAKGQDSTFKSGVKEEYRHDDSNPQSSSISSQKGNLDIHQAEAQQDSLPDGIIPTTAAEGQLKQTIEATRLKPGSSDISSTSHPSTEPLASDVAKTLQRDYESQIPSRSADGLDGPDANPLSQGHDQDVFYETPHHSSPVLSSLPRVKIPKHTSAAQEQFPNLHHGTVNSDIYQIPITRPSAPKAATEAVVEEEQVPEGVNIDLFHSPRIAKKLGGRPQGARELGVHLQGSQATSAVDGADEKSSHTSEASPEILLQTPEVQEGESSKRTDSRMVSPPPAPYELRESKVPSSRIGRLWNYGNLAAGMFGGAVTESIRRASGSGGEGSYLLTAANMDRLVSKLSRMRGAALKMGQMISFQDSKLIPAPIQEVLQRVQDRADYMPASQRNKVLESNLGPNWRELYGDFEDKPIAAASIGQVHRATLKSTGAQVAVKIQYPGVADSIDSDLDNIAILLTASRMLPKGLFLDKTIANARTELAWECDYVREAECARRFQELLADETDVFVVPKVYAEASGKQVLTMEYVQGIGVTRVQSFTQEQRDWIGTQILRLCLREIVEFRFMQTDPNWTNFLYNAESKKLELLDFGASREFPEEFITSYTKLLAAASRSDKGALRNLSIHLGYLTGLESKAMLDAHLTSILTMAEPFLVSSPEVYDFKDQTITDRVKALIPVMIKERLAPPPEETYSLHRKLSGAFLLCARLESRVRCRDLFQNSIAKAGIL